MLLVIPKFSASLETTVGEGGVTISSSENSTTSWFIAERAIDASVTAMFSRFCLVSLFLISLLLYYNFFYQFFGDFCIFGFFGNIGERRRSNNLLVRRFKNERFNKRHIRRSIGSYLP